VAPAVTSAAPPTIHVIRGGCTTPDPFAARGGVGLCVGGEWIRLWTPPPSRRGGR
jgi:hypothetical protein